MEGISHEACALAGAWKLDKLIALYDDNGISIDGAVAPWFVDDTPQALRGLRLERDRRRRRPRRRRGRRGDRRARAQSTDRPTLICCKTTIGKGSPNRAGTAKAHGEALGADEIKLTRAALGWAHEPFVVPEEAYADWDARAARRGRRSGLGRRASPPTPRRIPSSPPSTRGAWRGELPADWRADGRRGGRGRGARQGRDGRQPQGQPARARGLHARAARAARRQRRPDRLEPHQHQQHAAAALRRPTARVARRRRRPARPPHQLRRARVRHGRDHERRRPARRLHPLRRHLPDLQRLQPQRDPHGGADEAARGPRLHARLDRPRRGRADAPVDRARGVAAADSRPRRLAPLRHARDRWRPGPPRSASATRPTALLLSRQNLPYAPKPAFDAARPDGALGEIASGAYVLAEPAEVGLTKKAQAVLIATGSEVQLALQGAGSCSRGPSTAASRCASSRCRRRRSSTARTAPTRRACCPPACRASRSRWASPTAGGSTAAPPSSASTATASRRRRPVLFKHFGFTAENVVATVRAALGLMSILSRGTFP